MYRPSSSVIAFVCAALWIAGAHCNTLILQPNHFDPNSGNTYAWIIPPQLNNLQEPLPRSASVIDQQSQSTAPGGCGHPLLIRSHSHEQLNLPNEYLVAPSAAQPTSSPVFLPLAGVNGNGGAATVSPNEDCVQQKPLTEHQPNLASVASMPDQRSSAQVQPVNWPSNHAGGYGLLFFVPESASHLPTEQLIRQQLALHRTQLPFDISMNCHDAANTGCSSGFQAAAAGERIVPAAAATTFNGQPELVENVNYASVPLVKNVNTIGNQRAHEWRAIGGLLAQQQQQQHQQQLSMLPL